MISDRSGVYHAFTLTLTTTLAMLASASSSLASSSRLKLESLALKRLRHRCLDSHRTFTASACTRSHYDTLALPHNASKNQIKVGAAGFFVEV